MDRPNILIITTDQQRTDSLGCYGSTFTRTPAADRLAAEGAVLNRAYCTNPVCTPSRASIFTGQQVSRHGAWNVGTHCNPNTPMISHRLADVGYRTHYVGKMHFQPFGGTADESRETVGPWSNGYGGWSGPYYGFHTVELALGHTTWGLSGHYGQWVRQQVGEEQAKRCMTARAVVKEEFGGEPYDWDLPLRLHNSIWTADRTIAFLQEHDRRQPFFLAVGFQDPHHPHAVPVEYPDRIDPKSVTAPDYEEGELADKPAHFLAAREGRLEQSPWRGQYYIAGQASGYDYRASNRSSELLGRSYYYMLCQLIDRELGRILGEMDRLDLTRRTLVIFTTDHGELLGDHGIWMKGPFHYEQLIRVPVLIRFPGVIPAGQRIDGLFSLADITPTCLAAAGVGAPQEEMDGRNALPLLRREVEAVRDHALIEMVDDPHKLRLKTIVTATHKLTSYAGQDFGELYDLQLDPREKTNRWTDPRYVDVKSNLLSRLLDDMEPLERRCRRTTYA